MPIRRADHDALDELDFRLRTVLPEDYQDSYDTLQPTPMGAVGLAFDAEGRVAWDEIWGSFCDLAVAGGPPHKGTWLGPGAPAAVAADPDRYRDVVAEICRGITMVTGLPAGASPVPGWIRVACVDATMAGWLLRAIVVENVAVHAEGADLFLPAAPGFRLEKEIKNVVTVIAKTCHYWAGHMPGLQRAAIGRMFAAIEAEAPLVRPAWPPAPERPPAEVRAAGTLGRRIADATRLPVSGHTYSGWLGIECPSVLSAVWIMRALVASNVLSRREGGAVFVPVTSGAERASERTAETFVRIHHLAAVKGVL